MRRENFVHQLAENMNLTEENLQMQTILEICGGSRVLIEHHQGVIEYSEQQICVKVRYGAVMIFGQELHLCKITGCQLVIIGRIEQVKLIRR